MSTPVIDSVTPDPVVIPAEGSVGVTATAHMTSTPDVPGSFQVTFTPAGGAPQVLVTVPVLLDHPEAGPVPWTEIDLVPVDLPGVTIVNNGDGSYAVSHAS